jgi:hypothetical protein
MAKSRSFPRTPGSLANPRGRLILQGEDFAGAAIDQKAVFARFGDCQVKATDTE